MLSVGAFLILQMSDLICTLTCLQVMPTHAFKWKCVLIHLVFTGIIRLEIRRGSTGHRDVKQGCGPNPRGSGEDLNQSGTAYGEVGGAQSVKDLRPDLHS